MVAKRVFLSAILLVLARTDRAVPTGNTFQVGATIVNSCTVSGTTLNFGNAIDVLVTSSPLDATSALRVTCTDTTPYTVSLDAGANAGALAGGGSNFASRVMKSGSYSMAYQLYVDSARASVWGDGSAGGSTLAGVSMGSAQSLSLYGRIPSLANVVPGSYSDTVTVTFTY